LVNSEIRKFVACVAFGWKRRLRPYSEITDRLATGLKAVCGSESGIPAAAAAAAAAEGLTACGLG